MFLYGMAGDNRNIRRVLQRQLEQLGRDRERRRQLQRIHRNVQAYRPDSDDADVSSSDEDGALADGRDVLGDHGAFIGGGMHDGVEGIVGEAVDNVHVGVGNVVNDIVGALADGVDAVAGVGYEVDDLVGAPADGVDAVANNLVRAPADGDAGAGDRLNPGDEQIYVDVLSSATSDASGSESENSDDAEPVEFPDEGAKEAFIVNNIREWGSEGGVLSLKKLDNLLHRLKPALPSLPLSYKTLLGTPRAINVNDVGNGSQMWYKSIADNLSHMNLQEYLQVHRRISLDINMDGLPLAKSSKIKFWPILGHLVHTNNAPFVIAIYCGNSDPESDVLLFDFVNEVVQLKEHGFAFNGAVYPFEIRNFILDAPARSLVKCCIGHGGYGACEKCTVFGEDRDDRTVYLDLNCPLRSDDSFRNREDPVHHTGESILEAADIGMISQFRLDTFHLVWHGVFRRLLTVWNEWPGAWRLQAPARNRMDDRLRTVAESCPSDFNRKPRSIRLLKFFKATEERRLLLYDGLLVFKGQVPTNVYKNYLLLHAGMYILCSPELVTTLCDFAGDLLRTFITHSARIYGRRFVVYNVHSLSHLDAECRSHGPADSFSAFKFENALKSLKATLMSGFKQLQQAAFRDAERTRNIEVILANGAKTIELSSPHLDPDELLVGEHFKRLDLPDVMLKCDEKNSCFSTKQGDIVVLKNIVRMDNVVRLSGHKFNRKEEFSLYPLPYSRLGIFRVLQLQDERSTYGIGDVKAKCWLMADGHSFVCVPLLHSESKFF